MKKVTKSKKIHQAPSISVSLLPRILYFGVLVSVTAFLQGCSHAKGYRGPTMDASQLAVLRGHGVTIHQVNDVEIGTTAPGILIPAGPSKVYLTINVANFNSPDDAIKLRELSVELDANKEYVITGQRGDGRVCAWPVSATTGEPEFTSPAGCL